MKKTYPVSEKSREWAKHLRPFRKRMANKSTRKAGKKLTMDIDADSFMFPFRWE